MTSFALPEGFDAGAWFDRWERMQEIHIPERAERFDEMRRISVSAQRVLDIGCGPASIAVAWMRADFAGRFVGVDAVPALLALGGQVVESHWGGRIDLQARDLRRPGWSQGLGKFDAAVSATALHWLCPDVLPILMREVLECLRPGGRFVLLDHMRPESEKRFARCLTERRLHSERMIEANHGQTWDHFCDDFTEALGLRSRADLFGPVRAEGEGVEEGLPVSDWLAMLQSVGFAGAQCHEERWGDGLISAERPAA